MHGNLSKRKLLFLCFWIQHTARKITYYYAKVHIYISAMIVRHFYMLFSWIFDIIEEQMLIISSLFNVKINHHEMNGVVHANTIDWYTDFSSFIVVIKWLRQRMDTTWDISRHAYGLGHILQKMIIQITKSQWSIYLQTLK